MSIKAIDLYCCAGGASLGLWEAGFEVTGVDIEYQKNYPFRFIQVDVMALTVEFLQEFDFIWASPPCQRYTLAGTQWRNIGKEYPDLIEKTRELLQRTGKPYVIENVPGAPLINPVMLCGTMFGLRTYRHRMFETNFPVQQLIHPKHVAKNAKMGRPPKDNEFLQIVGHFSGVPLARDILGLPKLNQYELAQSIPPVYSKYLAEEYLGVEKEKAEGGRP
ncbi:DNA cytosine methyltransferase [Sporomusa aerivorans]|uniref:DNA cytosine methyltransferase n=1 Tax=Sporomusa aerivorans TaxID=204936 RepID=UPI00352AD983